MVTKKISSIQMPSLAAIIFGFGILILISSCMGNLNDSTAENEQNLNGNPPSTFPSNTEEEDNESSKLIEQPINLLEVQLETNIETDDLSAFSITPKTMLESVSPPKMSSPVEQAYIEVAGEKFLAVASKSSHSLVISRIDKYGALRQTDEFLNGNGGVTSMNKPSGLAVSKVSPFIYVTSESGDSLNVFSLNKYGTLTHEKTYKNGDNDGYNLKLDNPKTVKTFLYKQKPYLSLIGSGVVSTFPLMGDGHLDLDLASTYSTPPNSIHLMDIGTYQNFGPYVLTTYSSQDRVYISQLTENENGQLVETRWTDLGDVDVSYSLKNIVDIDHFKSYSSVVVVVMAMKSIGKVATYMLYTDNSGKIIFTDSDFEDVPDVNQVEAFEMFGKNYVLATTSTGYYHLFEGISTKIKEISTGQINSYFKPISIDFGKEKLFFLLSPSNLGVFSYYLNPITMKLSYISEVSKKFAIYLDEITSLSPMTHNDTQYVIAGSQNYLNMIKMDEEKGMHVVSRVNRPNVYNYGKTINVNIDGTEVLILTANKTGSKDFPTISTWTIEDELLKEADITQYRTSSAEGLHHISEVGYIKSDDNHFIIAASEYGAIQSVSMNIPPSLELIQVLQSEDIPYTYLRAITGLTTANLPLGNFIYASSWQDRGVIRTYSMDSMGQIRDTENEDFLIDGIIKVSYTTAGANPYLVGNTIDSIFTIKIDPQTGALSLVSELRLADNLGMMLLDATEISSFKLWGKTFVAAISSIESGFSIFQLHEDGTLTHRAAMKDTEFIPLSGPNSLSFSEFNATSGFLSIGSISERGITTFLLEASQ